MKRVLFDQGVPWPLRKHLTDFQVERVYDLGWHEFSDDMVLDLGVRYAFAVIVTTDSNLKFQLPLNDFPVGIVVLRSFAWPWIADQIEEVIQAIHTAEVGSYREIEILKRRR